MDRCSRKIKNNSIEGNYGKTGVSYNSLEEDYKEIFLDVACILKGWEIEEAIRVLESRGFRAINGLRVLEQKSLISGSIDGPLDMHDHIQEMGRNIVRRLHPDEPRRHSRLWNYDEIEDILANDLGTDATKFMHIETDEFNAESLITGLANMKDLRVLDMCTHEVNLKKISHLYCSDGRVSEVSLHLPKFLRCLRWIGYPFQSLPKTFFSSNLVTLILHKSPIEQLWEEGEGKVLSTLRFLEIHGSKLRTLDLRLTPNLETLQIQFCYSLTEVHMPTESPNLRSIKLCAASFRTFHLGNTPNLQKLNLKHCYDIEKLQLGIVPKLAKINVRGSENLVQLHITPQPLQLTNLNIGHTKLKTLDLGLTPNLTRLIADSCLDLVEINAPIGCLQNLICLDLSGYGRFQSFWFKKEFESPEACCLSELCLTAEPVDVSPSHSGNISPKFVLSCNYNEDPSSSFGNLERLISLGTYIACINLDWLSDTICSLQCLRKLTLEGCIGEAPKHFDQLQCLEDLKFSSTDIQILPDGIFMLKHLKSLEIKSCCLLEKLPEDLGRLECLQTLILRECSVLRDIPNSICELKRLQYLNLYDCTQVENLPEELGCLECLKELNIEGTSIRRLPLSIFRVKGLQIVGSRQLLRFYIILLYIVMNQNRHNQRKSVYYYIPGLIVRSFKGPKKPFHT